MKGRKMIDTSCVTIPSLPAICGVCSEQKTGLIFAIDWTQSLFLPETNGGCEFESQNYSKLHFAVTYISIETWYQRMILKIIDFLVIDLIIFHIKFPSLELKQVRHDSTTSTRSLSAAWFGEYPHFKILRGTTFITIGDDFWYFRD